VTNDVVLIVDDSKFIAQAYSSEYYAAWVIEFSLPATVKLGFLLQRVVTQA
jgi:hypothetical protein